MSTLSALLFTLFNTVSAIRTWLIVAAGLVVYYVAWIIYARYFHHYSDVPGPFLASFTRFWLVYRINQHDIEVHQRALHQRYGPLVRIAPDEVAVADSAALKIIYDHQSTFPKSDFYTPAAANLSPHGNHFTQLDSKKHGDRRRFVNSIYSMTSVLESEVYIDHSTMMFMQKMSEHAKQGNIVDIAEWLHWYAFDNIGELFFGKAFGFLETETDVGKYIACSEALTPKLVVACSSPPLFRPFYLMSGLLFREVRAAFTGFDAMRHGACDQTIQRKIDLETGKVGRVDLLAKFFDVHHKKEAFHITDIQTEAWAAIVAGSDTTAIELRAILYYLMKNQSTMAQLVAEIDEYDRAGKLSHPHITYVEATKLPYLTACCKEAMRIHPSLATGLPRYVPAGGAMIAGRHFAAGHTVSMNAAVVHLDTTIFGADATDFRPERWLTSDTVSMERYLFHFGAGARTCIGKNIALAQIYKIIPEFLRRFEIELVNPKAEWKTQNVMMWKQKDIPVYVRERKPVRKAEK